MADARWQTHRPDIAGRGTAALEPGFAPHHRERLERGRARPDEAHAVPCLLPVLRVGQTPELPALSTQRGYFPRRAVQYRVLCLAHSHARAAVRPGRGRVHLDRRRLPSLFEPSPAGGRAALARATRDAEAGADAPAAVRVRLRVRGFPDRELPAPPGDQGAGGRLE